MEALGNILPINKLENEMRFREFGKIIQVIRVSREPDSDKDSKEGIARWRRRAPLRRDAVPLVGSAADGD